MKYKNHKPSGSRVNLSNGVRASNVENSDSEKDDYPLRASEMKDLKQPVKPLFRSESDIDVTIHSDEESDIEDEEDCHIVVLEDCLRSVGTKFNFQEIDPRIIHFREISKGEILNRQKSNFSSVFPNRFFQYYQSNR